MIAQAALHGVALSTLALFHVFTVRFTSQEAVSPAPLRQLNTKAAKMFALRKLPALVVRKAGSLQMLAPRQPVLHASRTRTALFCAAQGKATGKPCRC